MWLLSFCAFCSASFLHFLLPCSYHCSSPNGSVLLQYPPVFQKPFSKSAGVAVLTNVNCNPHSWQLFKLLSADLSAIWTAEVTSKLVMLSSEQYMHIASNEFPTFIQIFFPLNNYQELHMTKISISSKSAANISSSLSMCMSCISTYVTLISLSDSSTRNLVYNAISVKLWDLKCQVKTLSLLWL